MLVLFLFSVVRGRSTKSTRGQPVGRVDAVARIQQMYSRIDGTTLLQIPPFLVHSTTEHSDYFIFLCCLVAWQAGSLNITTTDETTTWRGYNPYKRKYEMLEKSYRSCMVNSWNKFCFTGKCCLVLSVDLYLHQLLFVSFFAWTSCVCPKQHSGDAAVLSGRLSDNIHS